MDNYLEILENSLKEDYGDWGRTQYLIKRILNNKEIFESDKKYIHRLNEVLESKKQVHIAKAELILDTDITKELARCNYCDVKINLDEKSLRKNKFWFHQQCFKNIECTQSAKIPEVKIQKPEIPNVTQQEVSSIRPNYLQMIYSASLLTGFTCTSYFLFGAVPALIIGIIGTSLFFMINKVHHITSKRKLRVFATSKDSLIKSGISGFDSMMTSGLKKKSTLVISGPPGSGKTTFGLQFLYSGAKDFDEPGVYVTLSQNIEEVKSDCKSFGWDFDEMIRQDKILMIDARPFKIQDELIGKDDSLYRGEQLPFEHLTKLLISSIKRVEAQRVVIDSISILEMQYHDKFYMRQGLQGMIQALENHGATTLLISESLADEDVPLEWFITSGIIQLRHSRIDDTMERTIQVSKMRGIHHSEQIHPIILNEDGINVQHPRLMP